MGVKTDRHKCKLSSFINPGSVWPLNITLKNMWIEGTKVRRKQTDKRAVEKKEIKMSVSITTFLKLNQINKKQNITQR